MSHFPQNEGVSGSDCGPFTARDGLSYYLSASWTLTWNHQCTVEPPNKVHFGDNINSAVVSLCREVVFSSGVHNVLEL